MKVSSHLIFNYFETLRHIVDLGVKYKKDSLLFPQKTIKQFYHFLQERYETEDEETLMRPAYYLSERYFGDCDDYSIGFIAWILEREKFPLGSIYLVLCGRKSITHVYPIWRIPKVENTHSEILLGLDALPQNEFGKIYTYPFWNAFRADQIFFNHYNPINKNDFFQAHKNAKFEIFFKK